MMKWQELASASHYQTAVAVAKELAAGNVQEASLGLEELIDAVARSERRALRSQLVRLFLHILKWKNQPEMRSPSWELSILQAREEIAAIQEEVPSLTREAVEGIWDSCLKSAQRQARVEMGKKVEDGTVSWAEAFELDYS